jgi:oligoendopeptidase F
MKVLKKYAVAYINFYDNELSIKLTEANNWEEAVNKTFDLFAELGEDCSTDIEEAKRQAFDADFMFEVTLIP